MSVSLIEAMGVIGFFVSCFTVGALWVIIQEVKELKRKEIK